MVAWGVNEDAKEEEKDDFFDEFEEVVDEEEEKKIINMGDLNKRVGNQNGGIDNGKRRLNNKKIIMYAEL